MSMIDFEDTVQSIVSAYNNNSASFRYLWIISDYLKVKEKLKRPQSIKQKAAVGVIPEIFKCKLQLYPFGDSKADVKRTSLFLNNDESVEKIWVRFKIVLIDGNNQTRYSEGNSNEIVKMDKGLGLDVFTIDFPEEEHELLLPNGCLQILVEGTVWAEEPMEKEQKTGDDAEHYSECINSEIPLFESEEYSDAVLSVGDEKFQVHKSILSSKSSVFKKLFVESTQNIIVVPDIDPKVFRVMMYFIYNNMLTANAENMLPEILEAARKFKLNSLSEISQIKLAKCITVENCIDYLVLAEKFEAKDLKEKLLKFISENRKDISVKFSREEFKQLPQDLLLDVFSRVMSQD